MRKRSLQTFLVRFEGDYFRLGSNKVYPGNGLKLEGYYFVTVKYPLKRVVGVVSVNSKGGLNASK